MGTAFLEKMSPRADDRSGKTFFIKFLCQKISKYKILLYKKFSKKIKYQIFVFPLNRSFPVIIYTFWGDTPGTQKGTLLPASVESAQDITVRSLPGTVPGYSTVLYGRSATVLYSGTLYTSHFKTQESIRRSLAKSKCFSCL